jgi:uncharacterized protein YndB with AHSA1/START domain
MSETSIVKTVFIDAPPEAVWEYLTDKDKLGEWYHHAESNLADGETYTLYRTGDDGQTVSMISGRVLEMDPPSKLVTTFVIDAFRGKETTVTWVLENAAGGTRLLLTHDGIAAAMGDGALPLLMGIDGGWDAHLNDLRRVV